MKNNALFSPSWVGAYSVGLLLALLYFLEPLVKDRVRSFEGPSLDTPAPIVIPVDIPLSVISSGTSVGIKPNQKLSLNNLLKLSGQSTNKLLINFWATWCEPCIEEIPTLGLLAEQMKKSDLGQSLPLLITISVDENLESVRKFEKTLDRPLPFLVLHDPDGAFSRKLGITKFPETFLVDSNGSALQKWIGPQDWLSLEVLQLLKKSCT